MEKVDVKKRADSLHFETKSARYFLVTFEK